MSRWSLNHLGLPHQALVLNLLEHMGAENKLKCFSFSDRARRRKK
jgi:hypothetical protein